MKKIIFLILLFILLTTITMVAAAPEEIRDIIRAGDLAEFQAAR